MTISRHVSGKCRCTMHKRKAVDYSGAEPAEISITVVPDYVGNGPKHQYQVKANCWVEDAEGRKVYIELSHDVLTGIAHAVAKIGKEVNLLPAKESENQV